VAHALRRSTPFFRIQTRTAAYDCPFLSIQLSPLLRNYLADLSFFYDFDDEESIIDLVHKYFLGNPLTITRMNMEILRKIGIDLQLPSLTASVDRFIQSFKRNQEIRRGFNAGALPR
jgi:hypothetical protein